MRSQSSYNTDESNFRGMRTIPGDLSRSSGSVCIINVQHAEHAHLFALVLGAEDAYYYIRIGCLDVRCKENTDGPSLQRVK